MMSTMLADAYWSLRARVTNNYSLREKLLTLALFAGAAYIGLHANRSYALFFAAIAGVGIFIFSLHRVDVVYLSTLFFTTIYLAIGNLVFDRQTTIVMVKEVMMTMAIGIMAFQLMTRQRAMFRCELHKPLVIWVVILTAQCFNPSVYGFMSVVDDYRLWVFSVGAFFVGYQLLDSEKRVLTFIHVILAYVFVEAAYGVAQRFMPITWVAVMGGNPYNYFNVMGERVRSFSTMDTVHLAVFAFMMAPIAIWKMYDTKDFFKKIMFALILSSLILAGAFTLVRGAWVSFILALFLSAFLFKRPVLLLVVAVSIVLAFSATSGVMEARVNSLLHWEDDFSVQARLETLDRVTEALVYRVLGYGMGTFSHSRFTMAQPEKVIYGRATENFFLYIVLETGWFGLGFYLILMFLMYRRAYSNFLRLRNPRFRALSAAIGTLMLFIDIAKLSGPAGYYVPESWHYWFFVAVLFALPRLDEAYIESPEETAGAGGGATKDVSRAALRPVEPYAALRPGP